MSLSRIARSLSAEWRKVLSTRMWWFLAIVLAAYSALVATMFGFMFGTMGEALAGTGAAPPKLPAQETADMVYSSVSSLGYAIPLLLGALAATGELRYRTLGLTFMSEPKRGIVLLSKTIVLLTFGILVGVAGLIGSVGAGAAVISATGGETMLGTAASWALMARVLAVLGIWAVIGFGVGVLVRNQAIAIVIALVFTQFVEPLLRLGAQFWEWSAQVAKFLPGAATDAFVGTSVMNGLSSFDPSLPGGTEPLGVWGGFTVIAGYAVIGVVAGWLLRWRRDVV